MNPLVLTTVLVTVGTTELKRVITGKGFSLDPVLGGFILGLMLFALTSASPVIGKRFSVLIIITAIILNGLAIFPVVTPAQTSNGLAYFTKTTAPKTGTVINA